MKRQREHHCATTGSADMAPQRPFPSSRCAAAAAIMALTWMTAGSGAAALAVTRHNRRSAAPVPGLFGVSGTRGDIRMHVETPFGSKALRPTKISLSTSTTGRRKVLSVPPSAGYADSVREAETSHGMPWRISIDPNHDKSPYYLPFWERQISTMKRKLNNLRSVPVKSRRTGRDMSYVENGDRTTRMHTVAFASDEYKSIRMTLMDAGSRVQVFTSVWYPRGNHPILACDLLQFGGGSRHLCISDFQPIHPTEEEHAQAFERDLMAPIRDRYPGLHGQMTDKFYDRDQFFSSQMLLGRLDKGDADYADDMVYGSFFPAYGAYVDAHIDMIQQSSGGTPRKEDVPFVMQRHAAYDTYSAARDPAHPMLARTFGQEWAGDYVYDVLFPLAKRGQPGPTR